MRILRLAWGENVSCCRAKVSVLNADCVVLRLLVGVYLTRGIGGIRNTDTTAIGPVFSPRAHLGVARNRTGMSENEPQEPAPSSGKKSLGILIALIVLSSSAGIAVPLLMGGDKSAPKKDANALDLPEAEGKPAFLDFGETVANLNDGRMTRYLRLGISLQVDKAQLLSIQELYETRKAILRNWLLSHISDKSMDDIRGAAGQNRLRREIQEQFNAVLFPDGVDRIQDVLFQEFNVQ